jgi:hydrogenase/urease accessory protein HupE
MGIQVSSAPHRPPRPVAAWILAAMGLLHGAAAFVFGAGGRTSANELEGFVMGISASVLLVGAVLSYGLVRLRADLHQHAPPR